MTAMPARPDAVAGAKIVSVVGLEDPVLIA
jgi:hypothetical protein